MKSTQVAIRIIPTYNCNFGCKFCYQKIHEGSVYLAPDKLDDICKNIDFNPSYITIMGGEVSQYPQETIEMCKVLQKHFATIPYKCIITNGQGDLSWYNEMYKYGITHYTFSVNSLSKSLFNKISELGKKPYFTVRINTFFNPASAKEIVAFAREQKIPLTLCTDLTKSISGTDIERMINEISTPKSITKYDIYYIVDLGDYQYWVVTHEEANSKDNYKDNNLIILPNGSTTLDFDDVINCKGAYQC